MTEAEQRPDTQDSVPSPSSCEAPALTTYQTLATVVLNVLGLALPAAILQVYDRVIPNQTTETLTALMVGLIAVLVIDGALRISRGYLTSWSGAQFEHRCLGASVDTVLLANPRKIEAEKLGAHIDRVNAIDNLRDFYGGQGRLLLIDLPFLFVFLGLFWVIAGPLVLVPLTIFALLAAATLLVGRALRATLERRHELDDRRYSFIIQILSNIETIKALALEPTMTRRYERLQLAGAGATSSTIFLSGCAQTIGNISSALTLTAVAAIGAVQVINSTLSPGELAACTLLATRAVQPVMRGLSLWTQFQGLAVARERVEQLLSTPSAGARQNIRGGGRDVVGEIELRDVSFRYSPDGPYQLFEANARIRAGEIVAVVGEDGSGKSTLLELIAGRLEPESGELLIDGQPEQGQSLIDPRQVIRVAENTALFQGTILDNLTAFRGSDRLEEALAAARALGVDEEVHRLPKGYDTPIGAMAGAELSTSLRQKLTIARALACRPKILLFDGANTSLDQAGEARLKTALEDLRGTMTIILVTHRPFLQQIADRVLQLSDGTLTPLVGPARTHDSLATKETAGAPAEKTQDELVSEAVPA